MTLTRIYFFLFYFVMLTMNILLYKSSCYSFLIVKSRRFASISSTVNVFSPSDTIEKELKVTSIRDRVLRECLSGFVVSLTTLPPSISYANTIGIHPLSGVFSSVIMGLFMSIFSGNGLIAGAAGVITIPIIKLVNLYGIKYMTSAILLAGILEVLFGVLKLGKLAKYVKKPVLAGFSNAFAIFLLKSQMKVFMIGNSWLPRNQLYQSLSTSLLCISCIKFLPKFGMIPSSLVGLIISSILATFIGTFTSHIVPPLKTLADVSGAAAFSGGFNAIPSFQGILPNVPYNFETLKIIFPTACAISIISIIATSLVSRVACEAKPPQYLFSSNSRFSVKELPPLCPTELRDDAVVGLGLGNIVTSFFGGFGGCGLIPNTVLNTYNGGNSYISSVAYSISTAVCVLLLAPIIGRIPMAALAGVMINVAISTFKTEDTIRLLSRARKSLQDFLDCAGLIVSFILCSQYDMGVGVLTGVLITYLLKIPRFLKRSYNKLKRMYTLALSQTMLPNPKLQPESHF